MESHAKVDFAGAFSFQSLLTRLMCGAKTDVVSSRTASDQNQYSDAELFKWAMIALQGNDAIHIRQLPEDMPEEARRVLFHERIHYWQLLSSPPFYYDFLHRMDRLRAGAARRQLRYEWILGQTPNPLEQTKQLELYIDSNKANWDHHPVEPSMVRGADEVPYDLQTELLFLFSPHPTEGQVYPAYGALLMLPNGYVHMSMFSGYSLIESAAYVSECLHLGHDPEPWDSYEGPEDEIYYAPWEFFRRLHAHRYSNTRDLSLAFLAMVDLSLLPDAMFPSSTRDIDLSHENTSTSYRFGKLIYRSLGVDPLTFEGNAAKAIELFQDHFCRYTGWTHPTLVLRRAARFLSQVLVFSFANKIKDTPENRQLLTTVLQTTTDTDEDWQNTFLPLFQLLSETRKAKGNKLGDRIAFMMLNVIAYRMEHRARFAVPHLYHEELQAAFPLPVILYRESYRYDLNTNVSHRCPGPLDIGAMDVAYDAIDLMTVMPLTQDEATCGFYANYTSCQFINAGLGCPLTNLTDEQRSKRISLSLGDWCHWKKCLVVLTT